MKLIFFILFFISLWTNAQESNKSISDQLLSAQLPEYKKLEIRYQTWLNLVSYLATPEEKQVFVQMSNDRDRDLFIELFWRQRDPNPDTEINEFRRECERRFHHVNDRFGRGTPRPGWMTDMGHIYMILGEPDTEESFENQTGLFPAQVWSYHGDAALGLPTYFQITFFKRQGQGEWIIYDPLSDGPSALIINSEDYGSQDYVSQVERIRKLAPTLAGPALSLIPGPAPSHGTPHTQNSLIMANILHSPTRKINIKYATGFSQYKGQVRVDTSLRFIDQKHVVHLLPDPVRRTQILHIAVKPKKITLSRESGKDARLLHFKIVMNLKKGDETVFQQTRDFEYSLKPDEFTLIESGGVVLFDSLPIIPGDFLLQVFLENTVSKEFSFFEVPVQQPTPPTEFRLLPPLLAYQRQSAPNHFLAPFQWQGQKLRVDPESVFTAKDHVILGLVIDIPPSQNTEGLYLDWVAEPASPAPTPAVKGKIDLPADTQGNQVMVTQELPLNTIPPGYYRIRFRLLDPAKRVLAVQDTDFTVSPASRLSRPTELYQQLTQDNPFQIHHALGIQYYRTQNFQSALEEFDLALKANPQFAKSIIMKLESMLRLRQYSQVLGLIEEKFPDGFSGFDLHRIRGSAFYGLTRYNEALKEFLAAHTEYGNDFQLINLIGQTYLALDNGVEALRAFQTSLALNPDQPVIKEIVLSLQSQKKSS